MSGDGHGVIFVDAQGHHYKQGWRNDVYVDRRGRGEWKFFALPSEWPGIRERLLPLAQGGTTAHSKSFRPEQLTGILLSFLTGRDLQRKGTYARFATGYRFQAIQEWCLATGHKGLLLFIDELDNVVPGNSCKRTCRMLPHFSLVLFLSATGEYPSYSCRYSGNHNHARPRWSPPIP